MILDGDNIVGDGSQPLVTSEDIGPLDAFAGDLVSDLIPTEKRQLLSYKLGLTPEELDSIVGEAAYRGYQLAETKRQYFLTTPDGNRDKTIANYKPLPYTTALSQSSSLLSVPGTGEEEWGGDPPFDLSSDLIGEIADRLFSVYPQPLLLTERTAKEDEPPALDV